jgi:hypothetical protein
MLEEYERDVYILASTEDAALGRIVSSPPRRLSRTGQRFDQELVKE